MSNKKLINEFERLVAFIKDEQDKAIANKDSKTAQKHSFRLKFIKSSLAVLKKYPDKITLKNYNDLLKISGIGKGQ